jgi:4-hydroxy-4-methyl-2-oxoglutarate aldolase
VGFPIVVAGVHVASGDVVVADDDGVVIVPRERLAEVVARLPAIRAAEADMDRRVREGLRIPPFLAAKG